MFIGSSSEPWKIADKEKKDLRAFFDKFVYLPFPDYPSRLALWHRFLRKQLDLAKAELPEAFDVTTLARISEGFSAGSLERSIKKTLPKTRVERMCRRPLSESEFLANLALEAQRQRLIFNTDTE